MPRDWFSVYAPIYDLFVRALRVAPVAPLLECLPMRGYERVLDLGGGTGRVAAALAMAAGDTVVLDACSAMLERVPRRPNLHRVQGRAQQLPFTDASFDVVVCVDALHHIKDAESAAAEMQRVLRPGGRILVQEFDVRGWRGRAVQALERTFVDDSRFITPDALESLFRSLGIDGVTQCRSWLEYTFLGRKGSP